MGLGGDFSRRLEVEVVGTKEKDDKAINTAKARKMECHREQFRGCKVSLSDSMMLQRFQ